MTRTDVMASSRPLTAGETATRRSFARVRRALALVPVLALLAVVLAGPGTAIAATGEATSGYGEKPTETTGTSPSKESSPAAKEEPAKSSTPSTAATLPRTGFDLRLTFAIGFALMGTGFAIVVVQRRARRGDSR
jgi:hypothetical protein